MISRSFSDEEDGLEDLTMFLFNTVKLGRKRTVLGLLTLSTT